MKIKIDKEQQMLLRRFFKELYKKRFPVLGEVLGGVFGLFVWIFMLVSDESVNPIIVGMLYDSCLGFVVSRYNVYTNSYSDVEAGMYRFLQYMPIDATQLHIYRILKVFYFCLFSTIISVVIAVCSSANLESTSLEITSSFWDFFYVVLFMFIVPIVMEILKPNNSKVWKNNL